MKKIIPVLLCLFSLFSGVELIALDQKSTWRWDGELRGVNINPLRVVRDGRLLSQSELLIALDAARFDASRPVRFEVLTEGQNVEVQVWDIQGKEIPVKIEWGGAYVEERPGEHEYKKLQGFSFLVGGRDEANALDKVVVHFDPEEPVTQVETYFSLINIESINISPVIHEPLNNPSLTEPEVIFHETGFVMRNALLEAGFDLQDGLQLVSLKNGYIGDEVLGGLNQSGIFLLDDGKKVTSARDWGIEEVQVDDVQNRVLLSLVRGDLKALLTLQINREDLRMGLEVINLGETERSWKVVFPHVSGISLSDHPEDDYYCYPLFGGLINKVNANLRLFYAANEAWWQMVDVYSPEKGSGLMVRSLDKQGLFKGIAFRKGTSNSPWATVRNNLRNRTDPGSLWEESLDAVEGSSIAFEYMKYTRSPGERYRYPEASIQMHSGDWKTAMQIYADWAKKVWKWRPMDTALQDVWFIQTIIASRPTEPVQKTLYDFRHKQWYDGYKEDQIEMGEFRHWWEWSEQGPFGVVMDEGVDEIMRQMNNRWRYFFLKHPVTGKWVNAVNDGDYDYNESMGGLAGLRKGIQTAHEKDALVSFYVNCFIVDSTTHMAEQYGKKYSVVNPYIAHTPGPLPETPDGGHLVTYAKWSMCLDNEEYAQAYADNMARIVGDTQVDALRIDQLGYTGFVCYSEEHEHVFAEPGEHAVMRAMKRVTEKVREASVREKPDILLMAEYIGSDYLAGELDGALMHESRWALPGLRPVSTNLFRFYFPEIVLFENITTSHSNPDRFYFEVMLWNGVGMFQRQWPALYHQLLRENTDVFRSREVEPLIPVLQDQVYANRFGEGDKSVIVFLNESKESVDGPMLEVRDDSKLRYFDLLNGVEIEPIDGVLSMKIPARKAAAVARFQPVMKLSVEEGQAKVILSKSIEEGAYQWCDGDGSAIEFGEIGKTKLLVLEIPAGAHHLKLMSGKYLVDAISLPVRDHER